MLVEGLPISADSYKNGSEHVPMIFINWHEMSRRAAPLATRFAVPFGEAGRRKKWHGGARTASLMSGGAFPCRQCGKFPVQAVVLTGENPYRSAAVRQG